MEKKSSDARTVRVMSSHTTLLIPVVSYSHATTLPIKRTHSGESKSILMAKGWLQETLADGTPKDGLALKRAARDAGIRQRTLYRAAKFAGALRKTVPRI